MKVQHACVFFLLSGTISLVVSPSPGKIKGNSLRHRFSAAYYRLRKWYGGPIKPTDLATITNNQNGSNVYNRDGNSSSRGRASPERAKMGYLYMIKRTAHAEVISSSGWPKISFKDKSVFVDGKLVLRDTCWLSAKRIYQKRADGSRWHTNLSVGTPMTENEIQQFERDVKEMRKKLYEKSEAETKTRDVRRAADSTKDYHSYLYMIKGPVYAEFISPERWQCISIKDKSVFLNNERVVLDTCMLSSKYTYQKRGDDSMWHTNLPVGIPMTENEIQQFERDANEKRKTVQEKIGNERGGRRSPRG